MLVVQQLNTVASQGGAKVAFRYLEKDTNYLELKTAVARLSYLFLKEIGPTGRVGFFCSNSPTVIEAFFALTNVRAVAVPLNPALTDEEIGNWCKEAKITHLAVTSDLVPRARTLLSGQRISVPLLEIERKHGGEYDTTYTAPPDKVPLETDVVLLVRTGGTAEKPHLVEFTHKQITSAAVALKRPYHVTATDRFLTPLNWYHPYVFLHSFIFPLLTGATCVVDHGLEGQEHYQFLIKSRITRLIGTPSYLKKLVLLCKEASAGLPGMKSVTCGLAKLGPELKQEFDAMKVPIVQCYGMTENLWTISMDDTQPSPDVQRPSNALPGFKYKVVDENGDEIEGDFERTGQLCVTAPTAMTRYLMKDRETSEKATKQVLRGTWVYTGDLATLDGAGENLRITYRCRKEESLFHEGVYVYPDKVDKAFRGGPGIQDVAGFVTKNVQGKKILACAIVRDPGPAVERAVLDWCKGKAVGDARPSAFVFVDAIPYTAAGSVNRLSLGRQYSGIQ